MLKLYNTLTRKEEEFKPLEGNEVRIYSCGPTVYSFAHIGNLRTYIFMDTLRRTLKENGYTLKHVMNITDVGHLESDADEGEDKMEKAARKENKDPYEIAKFYTDVFLKDIKSLNIDMPEILAKATDHIPDMLEFVKGLVERGYAYETSTAIYFDVLKLNSYGILSGAKLEDQKAGARIEVDAEKRSPYDFAVWIKAPENHIMKWDSPWGLCYPGWHIECSAMSRKYLGDQFDIHTGGVDHIPIHHENEIAQSKGLTGKIPAVRWMHGEFLLVDNGKMSKSLGNCYTLEQLQERGIEPLAYKMFCYTSHYRNKLNFTWEGIKASQVALNRLREGVVKHLKGNETIEEFVLDEYRQKFKELMNNDLNVPGAMGIIWEIIRQEKKSKQYRDLLVELDKFLGLGIADITEESLKQNTDDIPEEIKILAEKRTEARKNKDFALADSLRDELKEKGYILEDTKDGVVIKKI